jgi:hypothetical protein
MTIVEESWKSLWEELSYSVIEIIDKVGKWEYRMNLWGSWKFIVQSLQCEKRIKL